MEPFFLRCETCHARLRVRDERFVGQVQSCPKCGSMVHILAPAGWLTGDEAMPTPDPAEVAAAAAPTTSARLVALLRPPVVLGSAGVATAVVASGLVAFLALRGSEEVATLLPATPTVEMSAAEPSEEVPIALPSPMEVEVHAQSVQDTSPATALPPKEEIKVADAKQEPPAVVSPPSATAPVATNAKSRILTLEPVERDPSITIAAVDATSAYPPTIGVAEVRASEAQPAARRPARVTNVADQLAVPIESIDLPAMPVGKFVNLVSGMASVPIRLDAKVLGEVGLSMRSTVTVHGENTTIGKLLAGVLMQHQLTCVERDGVLVVVPAKR